MRPRPLTASLVITTRNRKQELRVALASAVRQTVPLDIVVIDDGSTDGTSDLVRTEFPTARLFTRSESGGLIRRRNEGAALATGDILFSIDDDAEFTTPRVVEQTLADFNHPRIGAVAIPFVEPHKSNELMQRAASDDPARIEVCSHFIGTAHALRRDVFLGIGAYYADLIRQGEETDFCLRLLAAGYVVRCGRSDPINHYESPRRDLTQLHLYGRRNDVLVSYLNLPAHLFPLQLGGTLALSFRRAFQNKGWLGPNLKGTWWGFRDIPKFHSRRKPVPSALYWLMRRLRRNPGTPLEEIESILPPLK